MILVVTVHNLCIYGVTEILPILQTNKKKKYDLYICFCSYNHTYRTKNGI